MAQETQEQLLPRLATEVRANEVKINGVEKAGDMLAVKFTVTAGGLEPSDIYELANLIQNGPMDVKLTSCQFDMGL